MSSIFNYMYSISTIIPLSVIKINIKINFLRFFVVIKKHFEKKYLLNVPYTSNLQPEFIYDVNVPNIMNTYTKNTSLKNQYILRFSRNNIEYYLIILYNINNCWDLYYFSFFLTIKQYYKQQRFRIFTNCCN